MVIELSKTKKIFLFHSISPIDLALSIRHIVTMIKSGLPIDEAIGVISKQVEDPMLKDVYGQIYNDIHAGTTLADAMRKHKNVFQDITISVIEIGEQGGTLEKNLQFLSNYLKKQYELKRKIKGATTYPIIIFALTILEMLGVIYFILPRLESVFKGLADIPPFTKFLLDFSGFIRNNGPLVLGVLIVIFIIIKRLLATGLGKRFKDYMSLRIPVFKEINKKTILSNFSRTLGILLESGVPFQRALEISSNTIGSLTYEKILRELSERTKDGSNLFTALSEHPKFFPPTFVKLIETGEQTGSLEENLNYLYDFYTEEVIDLSNNLTTLLEPLLLIFVGVMIGGLALLIITPIYQLTGSING